MHRLILILILGPAVLVSGCAALPALTAGGGALLPGSAASLDIHSETTVKLEGGNFTVVKTNVVGCSRGFALFGFLTIVPARFTTAMGRLYAQAGMQEGRPQTLAHLTVERSSTYLLLFSIPRAEVRADLVEFVAEPPPQPRPAGLPGIRNPGTGEPTTPIRSK